MTDANATLSDKQLADNVRAAARSLSDAWNAAADAGLTVEVAFIERHPTFRLDPNAVPNVAATVTVRRIITESV